MLKNSKTIFFHFTPLRTVNVEEVIKVISGGKFEIIKKLFEGPKTHGELCKSLNFSPPTISRTMKNFCDCGIVCRDGNKFKLTGFGYFVAEYLTNLEELTKTCSFLRFSVSFAKSIPVELKPGMIRLKSAKRIYSSEEVIEGIIRDTENMKRGMYIIRVNVNDIFNAIRNRCLNGAEAKVILPERKFEKCENVEIRYFNPPLQLAVIDGRIAYLHVIPDESFNPVFYVCKDRKCVKWVECLFDHFWENSLL